MPQQEEISQFSISVYKGDPAPKKIVYEEVAKLRAAFPALTKEYILLLTELIVSEQFTTEKIKDAVMNVIKNCKYPHPQMAEVVGYDKKQKLYTYDEMANYVAQANVASSKLFDTVKIDGKTFWVKK